MQYCNCEQNSLRCSGCYPHYYDYINRKTSDPAVAPIKVKKPKDIFVIWEHPDKDRPKIFRIYTDEQKAKDDLTTVNMVCESTCSQTWYSLCCYCEDEEREGVFG